MNVPTSSIFGVLPAPAQSRTNNTADVSAPAKAFDWTDQPIDHSESDERRKSEKNAHPERLGSWNYTRKRNPRQAAGGLSADRHRRSSGPRLRWRGSADRLQADAGFVVRAPR